MVKKNLYKKSSFKYWHFCDCSHLFNYAKPITTKIISKIVKERTDCI